MTVLVMDLPADLWERVQVVVKMADMAAEACLVLEEINLQQQAADM